MPVAKLEVTSRKPFMDGQTFGDVGAYELLEGTVHYAVDPLHEANEGIVDLELAPRDSKGKVWFTSDFAMLKPANPEKGRHRVLFDVLNRGRKTVMGSFNDAPRSFDPAAPLEPGNGYLMRHGYTVVFCGWQADVPPTPGLMGMRGPQALGSDGQPLEGRMLCWFQVNEPTQLQLLSHRGHLPHPVADIEDPEAILQVRDHPNNPATVIERDKWSFVRVEDEQIEPEPNHVFMRSGFEPGKIYELVYKTRGSWIVGLGFAAMRDMVSFLKYEPESAGNPCADDIEYGYAFGSSQSGRFLRNYLHTGGNLDESGRIALDGIIPHIAGGMRGEFNLRYGQPSKDICFVIPELFPFTDTEQRDPVTGKEGALLSRIRERGGVPKIMFTNTSAEYWRGDAALIHTDLETMKDAPEDSEFVRRYHFAGCQHGAGIFPPQEVRPLDGVKGQLPFNSVDYSPLLRAALENLDRWVSMGEPAPASRHPSLNDGTAVESRTLLERYAKVPGIPVASQTTRAKRLDYGPEQHLGRTVQLPAIEGEEYPALVSDLDDSLNDLGGIRLPELTAPVATYSGWNLRHPDIGGPEVPIGITGGLAGWTHAFPITRADREASGDPRLSIEERYSSREDYLERFREEAEKLSSEGYMLAEDIEDSVERAGQRYNYYMNGTM